MNSIDIVIASAGYLTIRQYLSQAMPEARVQALDPGTLRRDGARASVLIPTMSQIDGALMDRIAGLQLIQQWGAGLERVDIEAATQRGIAVANVPTHRSGNAESVAEWCVMSAIALSRHLSTLARGMREGAAWGGPMGRALLGRTATVIGLGGIGQALIERLRPFGMRLIGVRRHTDEAQASALGLDRLASPDELDDILRESDYVFLCLPLNEQTRDLIDERRLALMPDDACIVNPGRGGLLSERALLAALASGRLVKAALDVFETEPLAASSPLLGYEQILATPHIAGSTDRSYEGIAAAVAENVRRVMAGELPKNGANLEALGMPVR
ncbi:2-hydroxyacid dehydrogenase [Mangrovitalea sediminis]|uniref:2-hydroxyacid dehydrogenase n=1 Tax=Mangrovitalea sediminis TaxID=1982043 RepID=UPI000BE56F7A|nr:2-hydroxyacid dehydrogenase [Mangrovitalea sediminis]